MTIRDWLRTRIAGYRAGRQRAQRLREGVEAIVDRVDPRLRGLSGYRSTLTPALESSVVQVDALIDSLPPPREVNREAWSGDHLLHALFTSTKAMQQVFDTSAELRDFLTSAPATNADQIYATLSMRLDRRSRFGSEMRGDAIVADQQQVSVGFTDHRLGVLATNEEDFRQSLRRRVLEEVATRAMQRIMGMRTRRDAMSEEKSRLQWKMKIYEMRRDGLGDLWHDEAIYTRHIEELRNQVGEAQLGLDELVASAGNIEHFLAMTADEFYKVGETFRLEPTALCLDPMNIETTPAQGGRNLLLHEIHVGRRRPRIVQLIRFSPGFASIDTDRALRRAARALGVG